MRLLREWVPGERACVWMCALDFLCSWFLKTSRCAEAGLLQSWVNPLANVFLLSSSSRHSFSVKSVRPTNLTLPPASRVSFSVTTK